VVVYSQIIGPVDRGLSPVNGWIKVVTHPLGLAAFALFLVFTVVARRSRGRGPAWIVRGFFAMAWVTLIGGLVLAYLQVQKATQPPATVNQQHIDQVNQQSSGSGAVNAAGVQGSVTTNNGQPQRQDSQKNKKQAEK